MADEIDWLDLPGRWTYGVDRGGRIFFINDEEKSTSWVHPGTDSPIQSGYSSSPGLPKGWEMDSTPEGAVYFIKGGRGSEASPAAAEAALVRQYFSPTPAQSLTVIRIYFEVEHL
ncbi:hypothetical protein STEG23_018435 [Scotinomys teguina]